MEKVLEILKSGGKRIRVKSCIVHELWNRAEFLPLYVTFFNEIIDPTIVQYTCQNFRPILWVLKTTGPTLVNALPSSVTLDMEILINNSDQGALMEFLRDGLILRLS
uniref:Uncharacterized protein n=1 Tax=Acrobeloides nanus TaxID=290746 RepID=A0A914DHH8_9BILA